MVFNVTLLINASPRDGGMEGGRERGSEEARERGSEGARERGSEGARERGSEGARERGSEGARERGSEGGARAKLGFPLPPALPHCLLYFLKLYNVFNDNVQSIR